MNKYTVSVIVALMLATGSAFAADGAPKAKKPVVCQDYSTAKTSDGATIGLCKGKPGKRPRMLSTYTISEIKDPSGATQKVMIGYP